MPPKGSKRGPDGQWIRNASQVATPQKGSRTLAEGTPQKKARAVASSTGAKGSVALSAEAAGLLNLPDIRKQLNEHVRDMARTVNDDWHDSYEETDQMLGEWLQDCGTQVENVLKISLGHGAGFDRCHEVLKIIADTWSNINAIPFRGCPAESLNEMEAVEVLPMIQVDDTRPDPLEFNSSEQLLEYAWPLLLARAAADEAVTDAALMRMIKDAYDNGVTQPDAPHNEETISVTLASTMQRGRTRVQQLLARKEEWHALPTTKKVHRMRAAIDRRFDGPLHRRTRDPRMFEGLFGF